MKRCHLWIHCQRSSARKHVHIVVNLDSGEYNRFRSVAVYCLLQTRSRTLPRIQFVNTLIPTTTLRSQQHRSHINPHCETLKEELYEDQDGVMGSGVPQRGWRSEWGMTPRRPFLYLWCACLALIDVPYYSQWCNLGTIPSHRHSKHTNRRSHVRGTVSR